MQFTLVGGPKKVPSPQVYLKMEYPLGKSEKASNNTIKFKLMNKT